MSIASVKTRNCASSVWHLWHFIVYPPQRQIDERSSELFAKGVPYSNSGVLKVFYACPVLESYNCEGITHKNSCSQKM